MSDLEWVLLLSFAIFCIAAWFFARWMYRQQQKRESLAGFDGFCRAAEELTSMPVRPQPPPSRIVCEYVAPPLPSPPYHLPGVPGAFRDVMRDGQITREASPRKCRFKRGRKA